MTKSATTGHECHEFGRYGFRYCCCDHSKGCRHKSDWSRASANPTLFFCAFPCLSYRSGAPVQELFWNRTTSPAISGLRIFAGTFASASWCIVLQSLELVWCRWWLRILQKRKSKRVNEDAGWQTVYKPCIPKYGSFVQGLFPPQNSLSGHFSFAASWRWFARSANCGSPCSVELRDCTNRGGVSWIWKALVHRLRMFSNPCMAFTLQYALLQLLAWFPGPFANTGGSDLTGVPWRCPWLERQRTDKSFMHLEGMGPCTADAIMGTGADHHLGSFKIVSRRVSEDALEQTLHYQVTMLRALLTRCSEHRTTSHAIICSKLHANLPLQSDLRGESVRWVRAFAAAQLNRSRASLCSMQRHD